MNAYDDSEPPTGARAVSRARPSPCLQVSFPSFSGGEFARAASPEWAARDDSWCPLEKITWPVTAGSHSRVTASCAAMEDDTVEVPSGAPAAAGAALSSALQGVSSSAGPSLPPVAAKGEWPAAAGAGAGAGVGGGSGAGAAAWASDSAVSAGSRSIVAAAGRADEGAALGPEASAGDEELVRIRCAAKAGAGLVPRSTTAAPHRAPHRLPVSCVSRTKLWRYWVL
jgi:hypothetical protein